MIEDNNKEKKTDDIKNDSASFKCAVKQALYYMDEFLKGPMCGKCYPCEMGAYEAMLILNRISEGKGEETDIAALKRISAEMTELSRCKKGKDSAKFLSQWLDTSVFNEHLEGFCKAHECTAFIEYVILPEKCTMCAKCLDACKFDAILGEKKKPYFSGYKPFEIRQAACTKCGECLKVCPEGAVILVDAKVKAKV